MLVRQSRHPGGRGAIVVLGFATLALGAACPPSRGKVIANLLAFKACGSATECDPLPVCATSRACIAGTCAYSVGTPTATCPCVEGDVRQCDMPGSAAGANDGVQVCRATGATTAWESRCTQHCTDGQRRCEGGVPQLCEGNSWKDQDPCESPKTCSNGVCVAPRNDCTPQNCSGTCVDNVCSTTNNCTPQNCSGTCVNNVCVNKCTPQNCAGVCVNDVCMQCKPGQSSPCAGSDNCGGGTQTCSTSGQWGVCVGAIKKSCPPGYSGAGNRCSAQNRITIPLRDDKGGDGTFMGTTSPGSFQTYGAPVESWVTFEYVDGGCWDGDSPDALNLTCDQNHVITQCQAGSKHRAVCNQGFTVTPVGANCTFTKIKGWTPFAQGTCVRKAHHVIKATIDKRCSW